MFEIQQVIFTGRHLFPLIGFSMSTTMYLLATMAPALTARILYTLSVIPFGIGIKFWFPGFWLNEGFTLDVSRFLVDILLLIFCLVNIIGAFAIAKFLFFGIENKFFYSLVAFLSTVIIDLILYFFFRFFCNFIYQRKDQWKTAKI